MFYWTGRLSTGSQLFGVGNYCCSERLSMQHVPPIWKNLYSHDYDEVSITNICGRFLINSNDILMIENDIEYQKIYEPAKLVLQRCACRILFWVSTSTIVWNFQRSCQKWREWNILVCRAKRATLLSKYSYPQDVFENSNPADNMRLWSRSFYQSSYYSSAECDSEFTSCG